MATTTDKEVISRITGEWQGLFHRLLTSAEKAKLWYMDAAESHFGHQPSWHSLFHSLLIEDPFIKDNQLLFRPRVLLLSPQLVKNFLDFIIEHAYIVPDNSIRIFVQKLIHVVSKDALYNQLMALYALTEFADDELFKESEYIMPVEQPVKSIMPLEQPVKSFMPFEQPINISDSVDVTLAPIDLTLSPEVIVLDDDDDDDTIMIEPASRQPPTQTSIDSTSRQFGEIINNREQYEIEKSADNLITEMKKDREIVEDGGNETAEVLSRKGDFMYRIKELWLNCTEDHIPMELNEITQFSSIEMEMFCKIVEFDTISDQCFELICKHICDLEDQFSYNNVVTLLTHAVGHRINQLSHTASRKVSGGVTLAANHFPKQLIDSALVSCITNVNFNSAQSELISKIIKESLTPITRGYLIEKLVLSELVITEHILQVLLSAFDNGMDLNLEIFDKLLDSLHNVSLLFSKNLKLGKLLLAIVNKHGKILNIETKDKFQRILNKHDTFLKNTIIGAISKIK